MHGQPETRPTASSPIRVHPCNPCPTRCPPYSTCQFLGAFAGGAGGGWLLQHLGAYVLTGVCLSLAAAWWLVVLRAPRMAGVNSVTPNPLPGL